MKSKTIDLRTNNRMLTLEWNTKLTMMSKGICISLLLLFSHFVQAQDKKAKDLLDQVTAKIKTYDNIVIDFKYTLNNSRENINQESKGNVVMRGNLFTLNLMGVTKLFDGKKTYTINPEDEEITISKYNEKDDNSITPNKLLTFFNSGYKFNWDILQDIKGRKIQYIKLTPTNPKDQRKEILLGIDNQTKNIYN